MHIPTLIGRAQESVVIKNDMLDRYAHKAIKITKEIIRINKKEGICHFNFNDIRYWLENILSKQRMSMCMRSPCGSGEAMVGFDSSGNIYPCEVLIGFREFKRKNILNIGSLHEYLGKNKKNQKLRERKVDNIVKCRSCPWKNFCGSGCAASAHKDFNNYFREDPQCRYVSKVIEELIWLSNKN